MKSLKWWEDRNHMNRQEKMSRVGVCLFVCFSRLYTSHGAWTHTSEIKSCILYRLSPVSSGSLKREKGSWGRRDKGKSEERERKKWEKEGEMLRGETPIHKSQRTESFRETERYNMKGATQWWLPWSNPFFSTGSRNSCRFVIPSTKMLISFSS